MNGDVVDLLREYVEECESANGKAGTRGKRLLQIADMVERDATNAEIAKLIAERDEWKAKYEGQASLAGRSSSSYLRKLDECEELERERDEWKAKADDAQATIDRMQEVIDGYEDSTTDLEAEIDEWKANVKTLADYSEYWRGRCAKLEYRSDKRAAAVERLMKCHPSGYFNVLRDAFGWERGSKHTDKEWRDALIDLLTDDDAHSKTEPKLSEQSELLSDEADSREKLEADVREYYRIGLPGIQETELHRLYYEQIIEWLDRQAAIVERETIDKWDMTAALRLAEQDRTIVGYAEKNAELGSGACEVVRTFAARNKYERGRETVELSCGHYATIHDAYCPKCGRQVEQ